MIKKEEQENSTALSTKFAEDYNIKTPPKNIKIEIDKSYIISNGTGTQHVTIVSLRKVNQQVIVYFKWRRGGENKLINFLTGGTWIHNNTPLEVFKAQLLSFGQINEIELIYNEKQLSNNEQ